MVMCLGTFGVQLLPECGDERSEGLVKHLLYRFREKLVQTLFKGAGNSGGRCGRLGIVKLHRIVNGLMGAT